MGAAPAAHTAACASCVADGPVRFVGAPARARSFCTRLAGMTVTLVVEPRAAAPGPCPITDYERAWRLVHRYGSDTLAYFALRHDKRYFFASDGEAMVAYANLGAYALVSGDPIGHPGSIDRVIREFREHCQAQRWRCAFLAVRGADGARYRAFGMRTFYLGEEALIDTTRFGLAGKRNKSMRQSVNRVARTYRFEMLRESDASPELVDQLNAVSNRWRGKTPERGFTMALGQPVAGTNPDYQLCVAFDERGEPGGFLRVVPLFNGASGMTLDLMRRDPDSPNGMTEFLVANTVFALRRLGVDQLSMNFAVMGRLFEQDLDLTTGQQLLKALVSVGNPFFQLKSLHAFNRRFRPDWRSRIIVYEDRLALPHVALLYGGVEGLLSLPLIGRWFVLPRWDRRPPTATDASPSSCGGLT